MYWCRIWVTGIFLAAESLWGGNGWSILFLGQWQCGRVAQSLCLMMSKKPNISQRKKPGFRLGILHWKVRYIQWVFRPLPELLHLLNPCYMLRIWPNCTNLVCKYPPLGLLWDFTPQLRVPQVGGNRFPLPIYYFYWACALLHNAMQMYFFPNKDLSCIIQLFLISHHWMSTLWCKFLLSRK